MKKLIQTICSFLRKILEEDNRRRQVEVFQAYIRFMESMASGWGFLGVGALIGFKKKFKTLCTELERIRGFYERQKNSNNRA